MSPTYNGPDALAGANGAGDRIAQRQSVSNSTNSRPAPEPRERMCLEAFKPIVKGSLRGYATVRLPIGLTIADIPVCTSHGKTWASLPSKPILDADARHRVVEEGGKKRYAVSWPDRATAGRWSAAAVELVRQHHPGALDDGGHA